MRKKRPTFHKWFVNLAQIVSERSPDTKQKVGAVLVSKDNKRILGIGYNGNATGLSNKRKSLTKGMSGYIHAEQNCLLNRSIESNYIKSKLFVTLSPCETCAKFIINIPTIREVYYKKAYIDNKGIKLLKKAGVLTRKINE